MTVVPREQGASTSPGAYEEAFWNRVDVDPITLSVVGGALQSIAKEMAQMLYRMAYSSVIRESEDLGAGLFDVDGREFCESDSTPMHIGSLPAYIKGVNRKLRGTYRPGDVIVHNHPYHGASHTPDYGVLVPIFLAGRHIGFAGCTGHLLDVGGATPGVSIQAVDVWAEGKLLDAVRIESAGVRNQDLYDHIMGNVRTPEMNAGDLEAMIACCRLGARRFLDLIDRYDVDTVMTSVEQWMNLAETRMRKAIEAVPDGTYRAPDGYLDDDGVNRDVPVKVACAVVVSGDEITVDLSGSHPEVATAVNSPFEGSVLPTVNFAIRTVFMDEATTDEFVPQNDGIFRAIRAIAPKGTVFNPRFPRACTGRFTLINRIPDQVNLALAQVVPHLITAGNSAAVHGIAFSGFDDEAEQYWIYMEIDEGSYGGRYGKDGLDSVDNLMANTRNNPIEEIEMRLPMLCERYELRDRPPAPGRWRGGIGSVRSWRFLDRTIVSANGDCRNDPPRGLFGGADGVSGVVIKNLGRPDEERLYSKFAGVHFESGDTFTIEVPSGAGYGDPFDRDPEAVLADVLDGYLDPADARAQYGVVLDASHASVDAEATAGIRESRAKEGAYGDR